MCATARPQAPRDLTTGAMGSNSIAPMMPLHPDWAVEVRIPFVIRLR